MMEQKKFESLKRYIEENLIGKIDIKDLVAEVYNLFQDYRISSDQEDELYKLVDPEDKIDSPSMLWYDDHGCVDMWNFVESL